MLQTHFAAPERASSEVLAEEGLALQASPALCASLDAMPTMVMVLNAERQIVVANRQVMERLRLAPGEAIGRRPGELVHCLGAEEGPAGCGTAERCRVCGAVNTVLRSAATGQQATSDCRILLSDRCAALDLEVVATPFAVAGRDYTIVSLRDIAAEKRGEMLERLFFHDVINTAGGIHGLARAMQGVGASPSDLQLLTQVSSQLMEELHSHRDLLAAERGTLVPEPQSVVLGELLSGIRDGCQSLECARGRAIHLDLPPAVTVQTDPVLLRRVVGNLIKNACEASERGETVGLALRSDGDAAIITVHNPGVMPPDVQQQMFQRSFSTKGRGRGLGTYGSRLLVERYLGGTLTFSSIAGEGTLVSVRIPCRGVIPDRTTKVVGRRS